LRVHFASVVALDGWRSYGSIASQLPFQTIFGRMAGTTNPPAPSSTFEQKYIEFARILRIACGCSGLALSVLGVFGILGNIITLNIEAAIISIYMIPIGLIIVFAEIRWKVNIIITNFPFLTTYYGRGVFYIFIGSLALGVTGGVFGVIAGAIVMLCGIFTLFAGLKERNDQKKGSQPGAPVGQSSSGSSRV